MSESRFLVMVLKTSLGYGVWDRRLNDWVTGPEGRRREFPRMILAIACVKILEERT